MAPEWLPVLDMLVRDVANPRSVAFQAKGLPDYVAKLEASHGPSRATSLAPAHAALLALRRRATSIRRASCCRAALEQLQRAAFAVPTRSR